MSKQFWISLSISLALALLVFSAALAQDPGVRVVSDDEVNAVAKQLYCPVCENIPLDVCPTQACAQWRGLIREMLADGKAEAEIKQYFVNYYGDRVLATPPARGLNWLVYIIPPAAILAGGFVLFRAFKSWRRPLPQELPEQPSGDDSDVYIQRLEDELRKQS